MPASSPRCPCAASRADRPGTGPAPPASADVAVDGLNGLRNLADPARGLRDCGAACARVAAPPVDFQPGPIRPTAASGPFTAGRPALLVCAVVGAPPPAGLSCPSHVHAYLETSLERFPTRRHPSRSARWRPASLLLPHAPHGPVAVFCGGGFFICSAWSPEGRSEADQTMHLSRTIIPSSLKPVQERAGDGLIAAALMTPEKAAAR